MQFIKSNSAAGLAWVVKSILLIDAAELALLTEHTVYTWCIHVAGLIYVGYWSSEFA